ncbi:unnamed protein product [Sphagnum balticum]
MSSCSSAYVKANDARYGLKVASRDPKTSKIIFNIDRNIVDTIVGDMLFDLADESDNNEDADVEDLVFGNEAELNAVMCLHLEAVAIAKSRALMLFKRIQFKVDDDVNDEM